MRAVDTISPAPSPGPAVDLGRWELTVDQGVLTCSLGFAAVLGLMPGESFTLADWEGLILAEDRPQFRAALQECLQEGATISTEHRILRADGAVRAVLTQCEVERSEGAGEPRVRGVVVDITALREAERRQRAATSLFEQGFDAAPIGMALSDPQTGRYLRVNDALCALLGRSRNELADLTIEAITHPDDLELTGAVMRALQDGAAACNLEKRYLRPDGSIVWAAVHVAAVNDADGRVEALYSQKIDITERKEREAAQASLVRDAEWLSRIRNALDEHRMALYWQPIVDLRSGEIVQRELLLRMIDEDGSIIAPAEFLPAAERYGLMPEIDRWVIRQAVRLAAEHGPVEFNLSAASIGDPLVLAELATAIEATGVNPADLVIEVTETAMIDRPEAGRLFARRVSDLGCRLALDDFGTGFCSLKHLKELPADHLKIDIEFVRDLADSETDQRLVRGIVGLAAEFHQTTTAEGIEDERTLSKLRELGVVRGQGYLFGHPVPIEHRLHALPRSSDTGHGCQDAVNTVKTALLAFEKRDIASAQALCHLDFVLRPLRSARHTVEPYRGRDAIARYCRDVELSWDELRLQPSAYWTTEASVIVFGQVVAAAQGHRHTTDAMWVVRFRDGLIASVDVFEQPQPPRRWSIER